MYLSLEDLIVQTAEGVQPPERITVAQAAEKYRKLNNPGSYVGDWKNSKVPYLVEIMEELTSTVFTGTIVVGPAQTGKTDIFLNWVTHTVICDPADMMFVNTSNATARDFSISKLDRLHRHSRDVGRKLIQHRNADNTFDKRYVNGMLLRLSWPTVNELSGKTIPRVWLTDYDRMDPDIEGEGPAFDLAKKRTTSFKRFGMTVAESTPSFPILDPKWSPSTPHEAPPAEGILSLYNRGDRRRWRWRCFSCGDSFEPDFSLLSFPKTADPVEAGEAAVLHCPHCGQVYEHDENPNSPSKHEMNIGGRWVKEGHIWLPDGSMIGKARETDIASFWIKGTVAAFVDWKSLVTKYRNAELEYEKTGMEGPLVTTVNTDQGLPYLPKSMVSVRLPEEIKGKARDLGIRVVPPGVRFLIATCDVQKNRFVVQVHGFGPGGDIWIVDRFDIRYSKREDPERPGQFLWVNPGVHREDWELLYEQVIAKTYELSDGSGRVMPIKFTVSDSAGREGFTVNAYDFYRWLRDNEDADVQSAVGRFCLLRGAAHKNNNARVKLTYPDSARKDKYAGARGEIPVLELQTDQLKDAVDLMLSRDRVQSGRIHYPNWLDNNFFTELCVEVRTAKGWENPRSFRNESWDLLVYAVAASVSMFVGIENIDWSDPPGWAEEWSGNDLVFDPNVSTKAFEPVKKDAGDFAALAEALA